MNWKFWQRKPQEPLEIGAVYRLKGGNPFDDCRLKILDVKNGWVEYRFIFDGRPSASKKSDSVSLITRLYEKEPT